MTTASLCSSPAPFSFIWRRRPVSRSEEHTSELQSQSNLVCRLLLEKKNNSPVSSQRAAARPPNTIPPFADDNQPLPKDHPTVGAAASLSISLPLDTPPAIDQRRIHA